MNKKQALKVLKSGRFFSARFTKKDGSVRYIHARAGVKKHLKPNAKAKAYDPSELGYLTVWDIKKQEYRLVNLQTLVSVNNKIVK